MFEYLGCVISLAIIIIIIIIRNCCFFSVVPNKIIKKNASQKTW